MPSHPDVPAHVHELAHSLAEPHPMRRGSISERFVKCSKPGCPCATDPNARHGPYYSLTHAVRGKTQSRFVSPAESVVARRQVDAGKRFRERVDEYWRACEQWADAELQQTASTETVEKRGFKRASKRKSPKKSRS